MASENEVAEARERVEKKRQQLRAERSKVQAREAEVSNDLTLAQLEAEEARIDAELAAFTPNKEEVKERSSDAFQTADQQRKAAEASAKAQG